MITRAFRFVSGALVVVSAACLAYLAATKATQRRELAEAEERIANSTGPNSRLHREAMKRKRELEKEAEDARERAQANVGRIAERDPSLKELVRAWNG